MQTSHNAGNSPVKVNILHFFFVLGVAAILATLFTVWTPSADADPSGLVAGLNLTPYPTAPPPGSPGGTPRARLLIGIVAGHWMNDSGAVCSDGLKEVEVNQAIATSVQQQLVALGYDVDLLSEFDSRLTGYQAAALVSIHADSCDFINNQATGFKVAAALASPRPERAARLTACISSRYAAITGLPQHSSSVTIDMTSYHAFEEINEATPAAIIETGFLNLDRQFLTHNSDLAAKGIVSGILCYIRNESINPITPSAPPTP
ncbi:MAG: N-acetylmuramoyl-L-alanine amidase [Chloroflexota bacterium]